MNMIQERPSLTLDPSGVGKGCRSTSVIEVFLKSGFLHSDHAVDKPKTPLPIMRIEDGIELDGIVYTIELKR